MKKYYKEVLSPLKTTTMMKKAENSKKRTVWETAQTTPTRNLPKSRGR